MPRKNLFKRKKNNSKLAFLSGILLIILPIIYLGIKNPKSAQAEWFNDNWSYRKLINFNNNGSLVSDRKVKLDIDTATLITDGTMQSDCDDIRFTNLEGRELQYYADTASGACNTSSSDYYILLDEVVADDNVVYMYYGNAVAGDNGEGSNFSETTFSPASGPNVGSEEEGPGPIVQWSMDEGVFATCPGGTNDVCDSGSNQIDANVISGDWQDPSLCVSGRCLYFDGFNDAVDSNFRATSEDELTFVGWFRLTDLPSLSGEVMSLLSAGDASNSQLTIGIGTDDTVYIYHRNGGADPSALTGSTTLETYKWYQIAVTMANNGTNNNYTVYLNGNVEISTQTYGQGEEIARDIDFYIGATNNYASSVDKYFSGYLDEFKIYPYERSESDIKTDYILSISPTGSGAFFGGGRDINTGILSNNLIGYWKLDESSGDAVDSSGSSLDLTDTNTVSRVGGISGNAGDFEVLSGEYFYIADEITHSLTGDLSISAWIRPESTTASTLFDIVTKWESAQTAYSFAQYGDELRFYLNSTLNYETTNSVNLQTGQWYNVAVIYDASEADVRLYVNGELAPSTTTGTIPTSINDTTARFHIGAQDSSGTPSNYYDGYIDEVRLYNRVLTPSELVSIHDWRNLPLGYWNFNEKTGSTAYDRGTDSNSGTLTNAAEFGIGKYGSSLSLDGTVSGSGDTSVRLGNDLFDSITQGTIMAWIKPLGTGDTYQSIFSLWEDDNGGFSDGGAIYYKSTNNNIEVAFSDNGSDTIRATTPTSSIDTNWHHVAFVVDPSGNRVYIDGVRQVLSYSAGSGSTNTWFDDVSENTTSYNIGCDDPDASDVDDCMETTMFEGLIDEVRVYDHARTQTQIVSDMNGGHPLGGSPVGSYSGYWAFDEYYGDTTYDNSINNNNGDLAGSGTSCPTTGGCPTWTRTAKLNSALDFDGSNDYVEIGDIADYDYVDGSDFSLTGWFNRDTFTTDDVIIAKRNGVTSTDVGYILYIDDANDNLVFEVSDGSDEYQIASTDTFLSTGWHHYAVVFDENSNDNVSMYIDGIKNNATKTGTLSNVGSLANAVALNIGSESDGANYFSGQLDEIKIYNAVLPKESILIDFNLGGVASYSTGYSEEDDIQGGAGNDPIMYLPLDENTGTSDAFDKSGNANNGSLGTLTSSDWQPGVYGSSLYFGDSTNDDLDISNITGEFDTDEGTVSMWLKVPSSSDWIDNDNQTAITIRTDTSNIIDWYVDGTLDYLKFRYRTGATSVDFDFESNTTEWFHAAMTWSQTDDEVRYYINGVLQQVDTAMDSWVGALDSTRVVVGNHRNDASGNVWEGWIDEVRIYDYAQSPAQIGYDMNRGAPALWFQFDDCQGAVAHDNSINQKHATLIIGGSGDNTSEGFCGSGNTSEAWNQGTNGKFNSSIDLDGSNDYLTVASPNLPIGDFTYALWVNLDDNTEETIVMSANGLGNNELRLEVISGNFDVTLDTGSSIVGVTTVNTNEWVHLAVTRVGSTVTSYVNGVVDATDNDASQLDFDDCYMVIGIDVDSSSSNCTASPGEYINGQIDDLRIYGYGLSQEQIKTIMNEGAATRFGPIN